MLWDIDVPEPEDGFEEMECIDRDGMLLGRTKPATTH